MNSVAQRVVRWAARQGSPPAGLFHSGTLRKVKENPNAKQTCDIAPCSRC